MLTLTKINILKLGLLNLFVIGSITLLFLLHVGSALKQYYIRKRVNAVMEFSKEEKHAVLVAINNAGLSNIKYQHRQSKNLKEINIDKKSGVITINFSSDIDGGGKNLKLLPMIFIGSVKYPLETFLENGINAHQFKLYWVCTSSQIRSKDTFINSNIGTLSSKFSPQECRLPILRLHHESYDNQ